MKDTSHLVAIQERLGRERARLVAATTDAEREQRTQWVTQAERELADELLFLGMSSGLSPEVASMTDDDLMDALQPAIQERLGHERARHHARNDGHTVGGCGRYWFRAVEPANK